MYDINTQQFSQHLKQEYRRLHSKTHVHNSVKSWPIFKILSLRLSGKFAVRFTVGRTEMQQSILVLFLGVLCYKKLPESSTAKPEVKSNMTERVIRPNFHIFNKKLCYHRWTAWHAVSQNLVNCTNKLLLRNLRHPLCHPNTPCICCHITLWNINVRKQVIMINCKVV